MSEVTFNVVDYSAIGDGSTAIQKKENQELTVNKGNQAFPLGDELPARAKPKIPSLYEHLLEKR